MEVGLPLKVDDHDPLPSHLRSLPMLFVPHRSCFSSSSSSKGNVSHSERQPGAISSSDPVFSPNDRLAERSIILQLLGAGERWDGRHVDDFILEDDEHEGLVDPERTEEAQEDCWW